MKEKLVQHLVTVLLDIITEENSKKVIDSILDIVENQVEKTENKWDDMVIGGLCGKIREVFEITDNDKK